MSLQFVSKVCIGCGESFRTSNNSSKCYNCTLAEITRGAAPEEGDFNTAGIISGTLTALERESLQRDLSAVELGTNSDGLCGCDSGVGYRSGWRDDDYYDEDEDDLYGEKCPDCGEDLNYCTCSDQQTKFFNLFAGCRNNPNWYDYEFNVPEVSVEPTKRGFAASHAEKCGCGAEITVDVKEC